MIGILCEKSSAAGNFAAALGGMSGTYNGEQYMICCAAGHLYEFAAPEEQVPVNLKEQYHSWDLGKLPWDETQFAWKLEKKPKSDVLLKHIKDVLSQCDEIAIGTDLDPTGEGSLLAWEILLSLKFRPKKWSRLCFDDESKASIQKAFVGRKPLSGPSADPDYLKAAFRSRWDFLSMQFTRIATKSGDGRSVLRQGRLKSCMIVLVGDALVALKNYKKIPFYQNRFRDENGNVYANAEEPMYKSRNEVLQAYHPSDVIVDKAEMKHTAPSALLDLSKLSASLAPKGYSTKEVLETYQKMYQKQILSYPRTEDRFVTKEQFKELLPFIDKIAGLVGVDPALLTHRTPRAGHVKDGCVHGANRPGLNVPDDLNDLAQYGPSAIAIYKTLARNYLAMLCEDYEYEYQAGHLKDYPDFKGTAQVPKKPGWKAVYGGIQDADNPDEEDTSKGLGRRAAPFVYEGFPPKPPTPTQTWLMNQLDKRNVGTGATKGATYVEITNQKAKYPLLKDTRGRISMTQFGEMSYRLLPGTHIGDLTLTEQVQDQMKKVAAGADPGPFLADMARLVREDMRVMQANSVSMKKEMGVMSQGDKEYAQGVWNGKAVRFVRTYSGHRFTDSEVSDLLAGKEIEVKDFKSAKGTSYGAKGRLADLTYNGHAYVGFERTGFLNGPSQKSDGTYSCPSGWCGVTFTDDEKTILESGRPLKRGGYVSRKTGNMFECTLKFDKKTGKLTPDFN